MRILVVMAVAVVCVVGVGCGPATKPQVCVPGKSEACIGPGGCAGGQKCNAEGTGLDDCDCGSAGGGGGSLGGGAGGGGGSVGGGTGGGETGGGTGGGATGGGSGGGATGGGSGGGATGGGAPDDGGMDAGMDAGIDAGMDAGIDAGVDAGIDAGPTPCDPAPADGGSPGCQPDQRCTWVAVTSTPSSTGLSICVPDGTVAIGGACTWGPDGLTTGYDNCAAGGICVSGTCRRICALDDPNSCGLDACVTYSGLFANELEAPAAGACAPSCDPLDHTQVCTQPGQGCYVLVTSTSTISVCAGAGTLTPGQVITGQAFANSCVPGARPRVVFGTSTMECGGFCTPAEVTVGVNVASEGGVAPNSCQTRWGAAAPSDPTAGESCRYFWAVEPFDPLTRFSNTLGFCFKHAAALYDSDGDMTRDAPFPRCTTLTTGDLLPPIQNPPENDALSFWCVEKPVMKRPQAVQRDAAFVLQTLTNWR